MSALGRRGTIQVDKTCSEVIGWIFPRADVTTMILENVDKQGYAAYSSGYVSLAYHLPEAQIYLTEDWLKGIKMDLVETLKRMLMPGKNLRTKENWRI